MDTMGWTTLFSLPKSINVFDAKGLLNPYSTVVLCAVFCIFFLGKTRNTKVPYAGCRSLWEPTFMLGLRFTRGAWPIVSEGYRKFKHDMFKIRRNDSDILIISNKYVDDLRALPDTTLSAMAAHVKNMLGSYSTTPVLLKSDIGTRVLQTKLTPNLGLFIEVIKDELNFALAVELSETNSATALQPVDMVHVLLRTVARVSGRVFVGLPLCRDEDWLATSIEYTESIFMTIVALRLVPFFLRPILVWLLPSSYKIHYHLRRAKRLIVPIIRRRRELESTTGYRKPFDLLQWMMDIARPHEAAESHLAHRQLLLSFAAIHTTTMAAVNALYDLCAYPETIISLREEIEQALAENGGWTKATINKMQKLDSFLKESQRINPPALISFNRIAIKTITLSDGVQLQKGTHLAVASAAILADEDNISDPDVFDPFRSYRRRQSLKEATRHQYTTTDKDHLHFGHGKYACPGRFFAAYELKIILATLLLTYDFRFPKGKSRPINLTIDETIYPDPAARLILKRRS